MALIRVTLHSDGSSDAALLPIISWTIHQPSPDRQVEIVWADLRRLPRAPTGLARRIESAVALYPCDLLCVHRDAENQDPLLRYQEIQDAIAPLRARPNFAPHVCIVPARMQEAWLLLDEAAIREAAGNPNGQMRLDMPPIDRIEHLPDPKQHLFELIRMASGLSARRRKRLPVTSHAYRVSSIISDFTPLRRLRAFNTFENDIRQILARL